ncbi:TyeA family type III secretion system gatekeeper subunit [Photobacterium leiognathi]|uniref:TyeA family type III secretion system gatekeeper subunit n=1 Tax=Photobacterium leiognathi TaxID=553611 RepID=UPI0029819BA7|nr:TyeA family type III secretion system gatekeeper subunit [Photobacterium leiognathi]
MDYKVTDLMSDFIALVELRWAGSEEIWNLASAMELESTEQKISFFRELHKLIRHIPIDVFSDEEQRQNLIKSVQKVLDEAIDLEEQGDATI